MQINANNKISNLNKFYAFVIFLFSPVLAIILAVRQYKETWAKNIVWVFCSYYGLTFVIGNDKSDINRYRDRFEFFSTVNYSSGEFINELINGSEAGPDFLQPLIMYIASLFTSNFKYALALFGLIFGFFFSRNIWNVLQLAKGKLKWYSVFLIVIFSFVYAVWDINVMRFTLAAHIFFYGAFTVLIKEKKWGWIFVAISPFMHFTFTLPIIVLALYKILGKRPLIYFYLYLFSFFVSEINFDTIKNNLNFLPAAYREQSQGYLSEDYKKERQQLNEEKNFRGKFYQSAIKWGTALLLVSIYFRRKKLKDYKVWYGYLSFCLLFFSIFNILSLIPVMKRFLFLGYLFLVSFSFIYYQNYAEKKELKAVYIATPILAFYFIVKFRIGFEFTGLFTVLGGPVSAFFNEGDIPLISFLK